MNKALFVDLDGTLITTASGRKFPLHSKDWKFIPDTLKAVNYFYKKNFKIILITNQGGIEEGFLTERVFVLKLEDVCKTLEKKLKLKPNCISYYFCKKMIDYNRKPNPGMAFEAAIDYELFLTSSIMIGNYKTDKEFAFNAGISEYFDVNDLTNIDW